MIAKKANIKSNFRREISTYPRARDAWQAVLEAYKSKHPSAKVVLPSYIGWTITEGSGIFDPVTNAGMPFDFYALDKRLRINLDDLKEKVNNNTESVVLLVHYFGFPDERYEEITNWLDENGVFYIEDAAHGMMSDLIGNSCGRRGAFSFFSLHKNLPLPDGGMLVDNGRYSLEIEHTDYMDSKAIFSYDIHGIYAKRRENYQVLVDQLNDVDGIELLYPELDENVSPQSCPILIKNKNRDDIFKAMNDNGFGLVSLYYHMIEPLRETAYESANYTSKHITNLPVHQDCKASELIKLTEYLKELIA
ncbi:MAG: hypothetical protein HKO67_01765 [Flavobacteriaceae bacterium]|nr:hypothetical protein [Flavobacteriaceae bacterium]